MSPISSGRAQRISEERSENWRVSVGSRIRRKNSRVYVPPSNILSEEGRQILAEDFLDIQAVASIFYFEGEYEYSQDFAVAGEDGIIETPRIISGLIIDPYMETAALSELNFHFVNSHFLHPDDVLDEDRALSRDGRSFAAGWRSIWTGSIRRRL